MPDGGKADPNRLATAVFVLLVLATFAAFFVAQRLKSQPAVLANLTATPFFSPNQDGRFDRARMGLELRRDERVTATVVDAGGDEVRTLLDGARVRRRQHLELAWDGRDDAGRRVPDGEYRVRIALGRQGRVIDVPRPIRLDTAPPTPQVLAIGPVAGPGPELLPTARGAPAEIRFRAPGRKVSVEVWRTDRGRPRLLTALPVGRLAPDGTGTTTWDGTVRGRRVGAGTFRVIVRCRDPEGNIGTSAPRGAGITVRYLAAQPPLEPVPAGRSLTVAVDARGAPFTWTLRRVGERVPLRRGRRTRGGPLTLRAPGGRSGVYLFAARTRTHAAAVPLAVDDRPRHSVLVVLPAVTWQGRNPVDDDGDGLPDTLDRGAPVRLGRVFARGELPVGFAGEEGPLLGFLDRERLRYDLTTDVALAAGQGPQLAGHDGVLLTGDTRWATQPVRAGLRAFAARGGTVVSLGVESLRRSVRQAGDVLSAPSGPAPVDLFGARLGPLRSPPVTLTNLQDARIELFAGEEGVFRAVRGWEPTVSVGAEARVLSTAVTPTGAPVVVAARFGRGLVVRPGIAAFASRLSGDPASAALMRRAWTLLSG